jgi:hypothetical protein
MTLWPSGLRRWLKAPFRKGVGLNPTGVSLLHPDRSSLLVCWASLNKSIQVETCQAITNQHKSAIISKGLLRELNPGPLAPEARIMPLDQAAMWWSLIIVSILVLLLRAQKDWPQCGKYRTLPSMATTRCKQWKTPTVGLEPTTTRLRALRSAD